MGWHLHQLSEPSDLLGLEAKWMGVGRLTPESKHRRIDILCIPYEQWGAALLYFTGNAIVSESNTTLLTISSTAACACTPGRRATPSTSGGSPKGLYAIALARRQRKVSDHPRDILTPTGEIIASRTEQEIFDVLGLRWRPPEHRRP